MKYDLEDRTKTFAKNIVKLCNRASKSPVSAPIINQLVRAGTSIGANYAEANGASSRKDFRNKIYICKKEAIETKYWLGMLNEACPSLKDEPLNLLKEAHELTLIFSKIAKSSS
jgi:four helix bundle protein